MCLARSADKVFVRAYWSYRENRSKKHQDFLKSKELLNVAAITVWGIAVGYYFSEKTDDSKEATGGEIAGDTEADKVKDIPASKLKIVVSSIKDNDEKAMNFTGSDNDNVATVDNDNQTKKENSMK